MKERKVTAARLLALADTISMMSSEAGEQVNPQSLTGHLNAALVDVLDAAKSAAFNEALAAHNEATPEQSSDAEKPSNG